ncbi:DUF3883 domain-containing protein [Rhizobium leguminosarum]|uniref:DUF3883 domain-containing protein n=1 Tax=Rhizobium leguminosarum TaxID=384 RepID=UPI003F9C2AB9
MNENWTAMLRSVQIRRDVDARFYKPVCLLSVIDEIDDGTLAPSDIDPRRVFARFSSYLADIAPERAPMGWRPFWHLSRDGAWIFRSGDFVVGPEDFGRQRKPNSKRELEAKIDLVSVPTQTRQFWLSRDDREELREAVIEMLQRDDETCRLIAEGLVHNKVGQPPSIEKSLPGGFTQTRQGAHSRQGFSASSVVRMAIEVRAMEVVEQYLASQGWIISDVSATQSYDLLCRRGTEIKYVEVKGTSGEGQEILITAAEVAFAHAHAPEMCLAIVSKIVLLEDARGGISASGGTVRIIEAWSPKAEDLLPVSFFCKVPLISPNGGIELPNDLY